MKIEFANAKDFQYIFENDRHINKELIQNKIEHNEIIMIRDINHNNIGWLRYGYFWDNAPFMNMLYINDNCRGKGIGKELVGFWESEMKNKRFGIVMTSTLPNEQAQHFYGKLGYKDAGSLLLDNEPML